MINCRGPTFLSSRFKFKPPEPPENESKYREYNKLYTHVLRSSRSSYYKDRFKTYNNDIKKKHGSQLIQL